MYIKTLKIKNFRSLTDCEISLGNLNAIVGLNDSGKSNLLRALNLFFNGQTDLGHQLVFLSDFSQHAKIIGGKAKQIEIEIEFTPPHNYADKGEIIWRKTYRSESTEPFRDELFRKDGTPFSKGSRAEYWVRRLCFEYVPAIRGKPFFAILKRRLYTTLAATVAPKLTTASGTFLSDLRKEVKKIETESQRLLQLRTEFSLPGDLGQLFEVLDFDSTDTHAKTALQFRGDGVQGRHVPLILKFLADQRKANSAKGKPPSETIWGFEEPENNLELAKQVETANEFDDYSKSIQIIVTTHSPAFYGKAKQSGEIQIAVRDQGRTNFSPNITAAKMDEHLGLMTFVQPYLEMAIKERDALLSQVKVLSVQALIVDKAALYVEGSTDKLILDAALLAFGDYRLDSFEVVAKPGMNGGANWVVGCCIARAALVDLSHKTAALFDADDAGTAGANSIKSYSLAINRPNRIKCFTVSKGTGADAIRTIKKAGISVPFAIEELCSENVWDHAEEKGWLVERGGELIAKNVHLLTKSTNFSEMLVSKISDTHARRLVEYKVNDEMKGKFARYVVHTIESEGDIPPTLRELVTSINEYFQS